MKTILSIARPFILTLMIQTCFVVSTLAQEVFIPDPGLNAAIRDALQKPVGPLTQQDMLSLTNLNARNRNVSNITGLETASNLVSLDLQINHLTNLAFPGGLTNLSTLDLSVNPLTNLSLPGGLTNLASLTIENAGLTNLSLPAGLTRLNNLDLENNQLASFNPLSNLTGLNTLDLGFNSFSDFFLPAGLTNLSTFYFAGNPLTNITLAPGLGGMTDLNLSQNQLASFTLPAGMTNLIELDLSFNQLTNLSLPADLQNLTILDLDFNQLTSLNFLSNQAGSKSLHLRANLFTNFSLPAELTGLTFLDVSESPVTNITLPAGLSNLVTLRISGNTNLASLRLPAGMTNLTAFILSANGLTNLVLPPDLGHLESLNLGGNQLTSLVLPADLTNLVGLFVTGNLLTNLTLPPDMTQLIGFGFLGNPLTTFVLSEPLAATNLAGDVATLQNLGVQVFTYPLAIQLVKPLPLVGAFKFGIIGPPGVYTVFESTNLAAWSVLRAVTNPLGSINFVDGTANSSPRKFYRALLQGPPSDMVFVPPNTFTMGSPTNEQGRNIFEGPQTTVTLTRGFWIGEHEVTQGEYLAVTGGNPSDFPGDLRRPISSVSWFDATNYCRMLTQQELAAGRISPGSRYRLPTEAEWECAARAGTATRFSYGDDDPNYASLTNYAWFLDLGHPDLTVHPVEQKLPNPWGIYDMAGNVWEWCQDWYGDQVSGAQTDPQGPASNAQGLKVMRGGAYDYSNSDCRSASRFFRFALFPDTDLGFRVVLVTGP